MTRPQLLAAIAQRTGNRRNLEPVVDAVLAEVAELMRRHKLDVDWNGSDVLRVLDGWRQTERQGK